MTAARADTAAILAPPPLLFFACLLVGWGVGFLWPFEPIALGIPVRIAVASALCLAALGLAIPALVIMHRSHTPAEPWLPTTAIVTSGPYRFTRNPMYVALLLVLAGIAAMTASGWLMLSVPVLFLLLDHGVVAAEERYLSAKFGDPYRDYLRHVRRWI